MIYIKNFTYDACETLDLSAYESYQNINHINLLKIMYNNCILIYLLI